MCLGFLFFIVVYRFFCYLFLSVVSGLSLLCLVWMGLIGRFLLGMLLER